MKSFIPWMGGKSQLCGQIRSHFPDKPIGRYIEVFGGGGSLLFSSDRHAPMEVFNDLDGHLINLYRCIKYHSGELERELRIAEDAVLPNSRELFLDFREQLDMRGLTDIQRAARYLYVIRGSFGANRHTFACDNSMCSTLSSTMNRLPQIRERLRMVILENRDFEALLKAYDRSDALVYLDPPYYAAEKCYDGFTPEDHHRLRVSVGKLKGRFVLSYNDHPRVRELYREYHIHPVNRSSPLTMKQGMAQRYGELIITNDEK